MLSRFKRFLYGSPDSTQLTVVTHPPPESGLVVTHSVTPVEGYQAQYVGGKAANLIKLAAAKACVPSFFVVPTAEYERAMQRARDKVGQAGTREELAREIMQGDLSTGTSELIKAFVGNDHSKAFAVRSSANVEDGSDSAFAGQFETHLNVHTQQGVERAVKMCFASLLSDSVQPFLARLPAGSKPPMMAVVVMEQINSSISGVYFQANPVTGATSTHVINAAHGQGEGVVGGSVHSDEFWLNASSGKIRKRVVSEHKTKRLVLQESGDGIREEPVPADAQGKPVLTDGQIAQLYAASTTIAKAFKSPQDIEWAFDHTGKLYILQSRPITTRLENMTFKEPDIGLWRLNGHIAIPMSKIYSPIWCKGWSTALIWNGQLTGNGFKNVETCDLNGFGYFCIRMAGPKAPPTSPPPAWLLRFILRMTGGKDTKLAYAFWHDKSYLTFCQQFQQELKPAWIEKHRKLGAENVNDMTDAQLVDYVTRAHTHLQEAWYAHCTYTLQQMLPAAWFAYQVSKWTGCDPSEAYAALEGFSPVTEGIAGEFKEQVEILSKSAAVQKILADTSRTGEKKLELLVALKPEDGGDAVRHIVQDIQYRLVEGYDPAGGILKETPGLMLAGIANAIDKFGKPKNSQADKWAADLRARIPAQHHGEFDADLAETRSIMFLRDERALYTDLWASGLMHHAMTCAAKRLVASNRLAPELQSLVLETSFEELVNMLQTQDRVPDNMVAELKARALYRSTSSIRDAPEFLGGHDIQITPEHFPNEWLMRSFVTSMLGVKGISTPHEFEDQYETLDGFLVESKKLVIGLPGSPGVVEGVCRVVNNAQDCELVQKGEIIVTPSASSLINLILPFASAIVTDCGATLAHAAVCAREFGIPCVVGTRHGTTLVKTGQRVRVDGSKGRMELI